MLFELVSQNQENASINNTLTHIEHKSRFNQGHRTISAGIQSIQRSLRITSTGGSQSSCLCLFRHARHSLHYVHVHVCVCVFVFVGACSDLSTDMNITCEFTSSKFQTLVATTSQNKGMVSCFVLGPFERRDSHLSTTHVHLQPPPQSFTHSHTHTHTHTRSSVSYEKDGKSEKGLKAFQSTSVSIFPFQAFSLRSDLIHSFYVLSCSQKAAYL